VGVGVLTTGELDGEGIINTAPIAGTTPPGAAIVKVKVTTEMSSMNSRGCEEGSSHRRGRERLRTGNTTNPRPETDMTAPI